MGMADGGRECRSRRQDERRESRVDVEGSGGGWGDWSEGGRGSRDCRDTG